MTVFERKVLSSWGTPLDESGRAAVPTSEEEWPGQWYELHGDMESERPLTAHEFDVVFASFVHDWAIAHPEAEIKFIEATSSSPQQHIRMQFIGHSPFPWVVVGAALAALFTLIVHNAIGIAIAVVILAVGYALYKRIAPGQDHFTCDICGQTCFGSYEELVAHFRSVHPEAEPPPRPTTIGDYIKYSVIIVAVGIAAGVALKLS